MEEKEPPSNCWRFSAPADIVCTVCICDATAGQNASRELPDIQVSRLSPIQHCSWDIFLLCLRLW